MKFNPVPPVTAQFTPDGILIVGIQKGQMYHRVLSWREMYKLAKKGKKMKPEGFLKQAADKMVAMTAEIARSTAASAASAAASEKLRATLKKGSAVTAVPVPPFMPVPMRTVPMAPPGAQAAQAPAPIIPPPSASEM